MVRRLRVAHDGGSEFGALARVLDEIMADVAEHFSLEEAMMQHGGYPKLAEHRAQHAGFLNKLRTLRMECEHRSTELMPVLLELLETGLSRHERTADREAAGYIGLEV